MGGGLEIRSVGRVCTVRMVHGTIGTVHSGSQDHHASKNSVHKTIRCNSTSNGPDDGRMYREHVELRICQ